MTKRAYYGRTYIKCRKGLHEFTWANTIRNANGSRRCRECDRLARKRRAAAQRNLLPRVRMRVQRMRVRGAAGTDSQHTVTG